MYNICMNEISFEWDENKNSINKEKHGVSFEEACLWLYIVFEKNQLSELYHLEKRRIMNAKDMKGVKAYEEYK